MVFDWRVPRIESFQWFNDFCVLLQLDTAKILRSVTRNKSSTGGWMVRALVCQADGRVFESNQWLSFDFQILSYLLRFKIRVSTLCVSFRTSHSWAYSPVTAVWSPSGQLAGCGLDYGCGRRRTMSIPVRLRAAILGAKRSYSCSSDCLVLRLCQLLSSIYD